jgi:hypothetical protein
MWTLGPRLDSAQVAEAAAGLTLRASFTATAGMGFGASVVKLSGDGQTAEVGTALANSLRVRVQLADGRPVPGAPVSWSVTGGGSLSPASGVTDADGVAAVAWTLGDAPGAAAATAQVGEASSVFTATAVQLPRNVRPLGTPVSARQLVGGAHSVLEDSLGISVADRFGRPIAGAEVSWNVSGGSVSSPVSVTDAAGIARVRWTLGAPGLHVARPSIAGSQVAEIPAVAVGALYPGAGNETVAGSGKVIEVSVETRATSSYDMPVEGALVHWEVVGGGGSVASSTSRTRGIASPTGNAAAATVRWTLGPPGPQSLRASLGGLQVTLTAQAAWSGFALVDIAPAQVHTCGVDAAGQAWCWGGNRSGQLGVGDGIERHLPVAVAQPPGTRFVQVAINSLLPSDLETTTCALTSLGRTYCWGARNMPFPGAPVPTALEQPADASFVSISADVLFCALDPDGQPWCWGALAGGTYWSVTAVPPPPGVRFSSLAVSPLCGLTPAGKAYCKGGVPTPANAPTNDFVAVPHPAGLPFTAIASRQGTICALDGPGQVYCGGYNFHGQLGDGTMDYRAELVAVRQPEGVSFTAITVGVFYACALSSSGQAYCWGSNWYGQLGDGTTVQRLTPTAVRGGRFSAIRAGTHHTCALEQGTGRPFCWGRNFNGQLGLGHTGDMPFPLPVGGIFGVAAPGR